MSIPDNFETARSLGQLHHSTLDIDVFTVRVAVVTVVRATDEVGLALELNGTGLLDPVVVEVELGVDIIETQSQNVEFFLFALRPVVEHSFIVVHNQNCISYDFVDIWGSWTTHNRCGGGTGSSGRCSRGRGWLRGSRWTILIPSWAVSRAVLIATLPAVTMARAIVEAYVSLIFTAENAVSVIFAAFGKARVSIALAIILTTFNFTWPVCDTVLISVWLWTELVSLSIPWTVATGEALLITWTLALAAPAFLIAPIFTLGITVTLIVAELVVISAVGHAVGDLLLPQDLTVWTGIRSNGWVVVAPVWVTWLILSRTPALFFVAEGKVRVVDVTVVVGQATGASVGAVSVTRTIVRAECCLPVALVHAVFIVVTLAFVPAGFGALLVVVVAVVNALVNLLLPSVLT